MKKKLISLFLIICLFSFVGVAKASDLDEGQSLTISESGTIGGLSYTSPMYYSDSYTTHQYSATGANGKYDAYCIDPHGVSTKGSGFIVTPVSDQRFAAAVSAILSSNADYLSKRTALVTFIYAVGNFAGMTGDIANLNSFTYSGKPVPYSSAFTNAGIEWACQNSSTTSQLVSFSGDCNQSLKSMAQSRYTNYDPNASLSGSTSGAYTLFVNALNAAANAGSGDSESESMTLNATLNDTEINEDSVVITANFDITDMSANGYLRNINFTLDGSGYGEPTLEYSVNGGEYQSLANGSDTNLAESLVEGLAEGETASGTITLRITLSKTFTDDEECEPASFTITYDYTGVSNYQIAILKGGKNTGLGPSQNYIAYFATGEGQETENSGELPGEIPCEEGEEEVCGTYISTPVCSDDQEKSSSDIVTPDDIKKCILYKEDDANNSYQLSSTNGGLTDLDSSEYNYCQIFCKEEYKDVLDGPQGNNHGIILQPVIKDVVCGGYFQLKAHIEGAKDCYTGGETDESASNGLNSIDKDQYLEDVREVQDQMIDTMNRYNEAQAKLEGINATPVEPETVTCSDGSSTEVINVTISWDSYTTYEYTWDEENEQISEITETTTSGNYSNRYGNTNDDHSGEFRDGNITCEPILDDEGNPTGETTLSDTGEAYQQYLKWVDEVRTQATDTPTEMTEYKENYKTIILNYNSCVTGWTVDYEFAQVLRYYYDETQGTSDDYTSTIPYYSLIMNDDSKTVLVPDEENGKYQYLVEVEICKGETNEKYECQDETQMVTIDNLDESKINNIPSVDDYGYDSSIYGDAFEQKSYAMCDIGSGCETEERDISQAAFVRKSIKKAQDYISPEVFYQIAANGKITTVDSEDPQTESLGHYLPISTKAVNGGTFRLILEDLGEFYDEGQYGDGYGRLIDYNGGNVDKSVAHALGLSGVSTFDGNYECDIEILCGPADCPECDFTDTPFDNCPNCDFSSSTYCDNCIFNLDDLQINVKPITTTDVISTGRDYGYNWIINTSVGELQLLSDKAELTINEIEDVNELIYDNSNKISDGSGLAFSIRLDANLINKLKQYNAENEENGGYGNDSLRCLDVEVGGTTVENLLCYSELLDDLLDDDNIEDNVPEGFIELRGNADEYWTLWTDENIAEYSSKYPDYNDGQTPIGWSAELSELKENSGRQEMIGGPAWK